MKRALEKNVRRRYQTALDLKNDLEDLKEEMVGGTSATLTSPSTAFNVGAIIWLSSVLLMVAGVPRLYSSS